MIHYKVKTLLLAPSVTLLKMSISQEQITYFQQLKLH